MNGKKQSRPIKQKHWKSTIAKEEPPAPEDAPRENPYDRLIRRLREDNARKTTN